MADETNKRCYDNEKCPYLDILKLRVNGATKKADLALPRWAFISAFGSLIVIAMVFAGWHLNSLKVFDAKYSSGVREFTQAAIDNKILLIELKMSVSIALQRQSKFELELIRMERSFGETKIRMRSFEHQVFERLNKEGGLKDEKR